MLPIHLINTLPIYGNIANRNHNTRIKPPLSSQPTMDVVINTKQNGQDTDKKY